MYASWLKYLLSQSAAAINGHRKRNGWRRRQRNVAAIRPQRRQLAAWRKYRSGWRGGIGAKTIISAYRWRRNGQLINNIVSGSAAIMASSQLMALASINRHRRPAEEMRNEVQSAKMAGQPMSIFGCGVISKCSSCSARRNVVYSAFNVA